MEACQADLDQLEVKLEEFNHKQDDGLEPSMRALGEGKSGQDRQLSSIQRAEMGKAREQGASDFAYTVAAARRSEQRRILSFIRMSDYMICDTLQVGRLGFRVGRYRPRVLGSEILWTKINSSECRKILLSIVTFHTVNGFLIPSPDLRLSYSSRSRRYSPQPRLARMRTTVLAAARTITCCATRP